ncbi:MAG: tetratricopeptide repeat protein [Gammaproteobacteria bacterium]
MKKIGFILALAAAFAPCAAAEDADMTEVMRGMFLSQSGAHARAAALFGELGGKLQSPSLLREAHRESLNAPNGREQALHYARRWRELGGGAEAAQSMARLLFMAGRNAEAEKILAELKAEGALDGETLFGLLHYAPANQAASLGRALFNNDANGNLLLAKLTALSGNYPAALDAITRGLAHEDLQDEFYLLRARIAGRASRGAALEVLTEYQNMGCPGIPPGCEEQSVIYAYALYARADEEWRRALLSPREEENEAALAAGEFMESAGFAQRARPYYEAVRGRFFRADLGLARLARDAGRAEDALNILDAAPVQNDSEFVLREATAAGLMQEVRGADAALERIRRAQLAVPDNFQLIYRHSFIAEQTGDIKTATELLARLTEIFPNNADGWNALGYILANHNMRLADAEQYIKKALMLEPDSANILDSLGWVYYRQGNLRAAVRLLRAAADKSDSAEIAAHLGEVYWHLDERERARAVFTEAKSRDPENEVLNETLRRLQVAD